MTDRTRPDAHPLQSGDPTELGRYEIIGRLGEGGQGTVYLGRLKGAAGRQGAEDYVAIKLLHGGLAGDEAARARFVRELQVAKKVARFCTAQVLDADVAGDRPYIVSEYVRGLSLRNVVRLEGPRTGGALERLAINTLTALYAIHQAGIIHRDFKPQNVMMGPDGPRVIDFGVARALGVTGDTQTVGTPAYMSPEHFTDDEVSTASDMFAWGTTMVFAATGRPAFGNDEMGKVMNRILTAEPELGDLSGPLRDLVVACLAKDPAARPTAREAQERLVGAASGGSPEAAVPPAGAGSFAAGAPGSDQPASDGATKPSGLGEPGAPQPFGAPPGQAHPQVPHVPPPPAPPGAPRPSGNGGGKRGLLIPIAAAAAVVAVLAGGAAFAATRTGGDEGDDRRPSASEQHDGAGGGSESHDGAAGEARGPAEQKGRRPQGRQSEDPASPNRPRSPGTSPRPSTPASPGGGGSGGGGGGGSKPGKEPANKYSPQQVCNSGGHGGGYYVQRSLTVSGGVAYLLYNSSTYNCAVMLKTKNVGKASAASVFVQKKGGSQVSDSGRFTWYAGPVYVKAPGACVRFGGNGGAAPYGNCG